mmetsp:Transcript_30898/g.31399  ORF Transcript_30898/g.31399 Transcript_30898/m.31399 type:complete len:103 (+) Transcript_30898:1785-2093(+)
MMPASVWTFLLPDRVAGVVEHVAFSLLLNVPAAQLALLLPVFFEVRDHPLTVLAHLFFARRHRHHARVRFVIPSSVHPAVLQSVPAIPFCQPRQQQQQPRCC